MLPRVVTQVKGYIRLCQFLCERTGSQNWRAKRGRSAREMALPVVSGQVKWESYVRSALDFCRHPDAR